MKSDQPLRPILLIGKIGRAHGLRGDVKIQPLTSDSERFRLLKSCLLLSADEKTSREIAIDGVKLLPDMVLLKLRGVDSREQAEPLNGSYLAVAREQAVELPPDTWFICDLIGCAVYDQNEGCLGEVADLLQSTAQDVYVVRQSGQPDLLFPALKTILKKVDIAGRRIDILLPEGLFEVYRERMA